MITMMDKNLILIKYFREGESKSSISHSLNISRKTVRKYINEHQHLQGSSSLENDMEKGLSTKPSYSSSGRKKRKLTQEIIETIEQCLEKNTQKRAQGLRKQVMKKIDIYEYVLSKGFSIGYTTVCNYIRVSENKPKEAFIKQVYAPGGTCEFDWGEVKLQINGELQKLNIAVFTSAYSNHRYAKLYYRQDTLAFSQSHIDYFTYTGGSHKEMVYDNMRVAVARFVGPTQERATAALLEMSNYYKFGFRFCNVRKGNEKGHVERSVEYVRRKAFCVQDSFVSLQQANQHLVKICEGLNNKGQQLRENKTANDLFKQEELHLYATQIPYKSFKDEFAKVDKYSTVILYGNRYSVPDFLVSKLLTVKVFAEKVDLYLSDEMVCSHPRSYSAHSWTINIGHYLSTLRNKPGALRGSMAFDQLNKDVKNVYDQYFTKDTKGFIELLQHFKDKSIELLEIAKSIEQLQKIAPASITKDTVLAMLYKQKEVDSQSQACSTKQKPANEIEQYAKASLQAISALINLN